MKTISIFGALCVAFLFGSTAFAADTYIKYGGIKGESSVQAEVEGGLGVSGSASAEVRTTTRSETDIEVTEGTDTSRENACEAACRSEYGGSGSAAFDACIRRCGAVGPASGARVSDDTTKQGEEGGKSGVIMQHNESDLDFLKKGASVSAAEVRGWDYETKSEFLASAKTHAEVRSGQDLENFARGVLLEDENIEEVALNFEKIVIKYISSGRLFGFIPLSFTQEVELDTEGDDLGRITVKLPWYAFLMKLDVLAADIEAEAGKQSGKDQIHIESWSFGERAEAFNTLTNVLKTKHDTAKNSINNVR